MSGKKAKAARRAAAPPPPAARFRARKTAFVGAVVLALVGASFVTPKLFDFKATTSHARIAMPQRGLGLPAGAAVPAFSERDLQSGDAITAASISAKKTLFFFSEGVMCQACFEQIKGLERMRAELESRGIELVSITPDSPADLGQAIAQYAITTPVIADEDRDMSRAFNTLGQGMHADTPGGTPLP